MPIHKLDKKRFLIFLVAAMSLLPAVSFFMPVPKTIAAVEVRNLVDLAEKCHDMKKNSDLWKECENFQNYAKYSLKCSGTMFYSFNKNGQTLWYLGAKEYLDCYNKAQATFDYIKSDKCSNMRHDSGSAANDSQAWRECENRQNILYQLASCSRFMFKEKAGSPGYFTQDTARLSECQTKLFQAKIASIHAPDGTTAPADSAPPPPAGSSGGATGTEKGEEKADVDCTSNGSPLSWIICPIIDLGSSFTDFVFKDFVRPMLENVPINTDPKDAGYQAWQGFRLLGNLLLVGTLLAIVYSQMRGGGGR